MIPDPGHSPDAVVATTDVVVELGGLPVLRSVSMQVDAGQLVVIEGTNGSGKTTLIRTVLGLTPYQHGSVQVFGQEVTRFRDWSRIGYVPQHGWVHLPHATVGEVVATGRLGQCRPFWPTTAKDKKLIADALAQVGMSNRVRDSFRELSGGQQQRVLIARALAAQTELLVMDEPFAGVDLDAQSTIAKLLATLKDRGITQLIVLHELGAIEPLIDEVVVLRDGRVLPPGTLHLHAPHHHETQWAAHQNPILPITTIPS